MNPGSFFPAIRGPLMLITVGTLFALDHTGVVNFSHTWPVLIIVFGILKLLERVGAPSYTPPTPPYPPASYPPGPSSGAQQ